MCVCVYKDIYASLWGGGLILHIIQLTPQKLSAELKNRPGAKGASAWPEDQRLHRRRRPGRRRYQEVPLCIGALQLRTKRYR